MAITESSRHHLHQALERVLGPDEAATLMEHLPPVGWADVATKRDLDSLEERMTARLASGLSDVRTEIADLRTELYRELRSQLVTVVGANLAVGSMVVAAVKVL